MILRRIILLLGAAAISGCASMMNPATMSEQARFIRNPETMDVYKEDDGPSPQPKLGHVAADLTPVDKDKAISPGHLRRREDKSDGNWRTMRFAGASNGRICFKFDREKHGAPGILGISQYRKEVVEEYTGLMMRVLALNSLDELTAETPWPEHSATDLDSMDITEESERFKRDTFGELHALGIWDFEVQLCAKAPAVTPDTRYLALVTYPNGAGSPSDSGFLVAMGMGPKTSNVPCLYLWEIDGRPQAMSGEPTPQPAKQTAAGVAPAQVEIAPLAAGATPNILQALKASGQHATFLKLLEVSGELGQLTGGEWTVLAPTDAAFERYFGTLSGGSEKFWGRSQRVLANDARHHLAEGRHSPDELKALAKARDTLRFLKGTARVHFTKGALEFDRARADSEVITATNGLIYTVDRLVQ